MGFSLEYQTVCTVSEKSALDLAGLRSHLLWTRLDFIHQLLHMSVSYFCEQQPSCTYIVPLEAP